MKNIKEFLYGLTITLLIFAIIDKYFSESSIFIKFLVIALLVSLALFIFNKIFINKNKEY